LPMSCPSDFSRLIIPPLLSRTCIISIDTAYIMECNKTEMIFVVKPDRD